MESRHFWMYADRTRIEFLNGLEEFRRVAVEYQKRRGESSILCPCRDCNNVRRWDDFRIIEDHLFRRGFKKGYENWYWHGEDMLSHQETSIVHDDEMSMDKSDDGKSFNDDEGIDSDSNRMTEMMDNLEEHLSDQPERFESVSKAAETPLYPGCENYSLLSGVLELFNLKAKGNLTDSIFDSLLETLGKMFPVGNEIPKSTYYAKKLLCPLGLDYVRIHACPNDCILYRKEYENLDACPECGVSRYKQKGHRVVHIGEGDKEDLNQPTIKKGPPAKVLWYLPIIPRFKRLFANKTDAKNLRWHADVRKKDGKIRHPADAEQWKKIDEEFEEFGRENRNLRLALCTDGMNPYGSQNSKHSSWPVLLAIYNLPPWLCMKRKYLMMPLLIPGPRQPGNDIDVYLAPLIDDMKVMWHEGVQMFDAYSNSHFTLRAMIFCTVNDFPAYGNLSGYKVKGERACPICEEDMKPVRLKHSHKNVYMNHRRFLDRRHPYRKNKIAFDGHVCLEQARAPLSGSEVYERVKTVKTVFGKGTKQVTKKGVLWKKVSLFWDLPYWQKLNVRHCLDVMHIEKNVCDAVVGTLLRITGKTKDSLGARKDMEELGIRHKLWAMPTNDGTDRMFLPPPCYELSNIEKRKFCECLYGIKVPSGYCSNLKPLLDMTKLKLINMKSHDCHVLMQVFLPVAIRGLLPPTVRHVVIKLCLFFNTICSKVIDPDKLDILQDGIIQTMCELEMYFPPSFFDIMVHLVVHLVREIKICGPVFLRWMYPFERHFKTLKDKTKNKAHPEGSIIRGYMAEEVGEFCAEFIARAMSIGNPTSRHEGRLQGQGTIGKKIVIPPTDRLAKAHLYVLQNLSAVHPYIERHLRYLRTKKPKSERELMIEHNKTFVKWFEKEVMNELKNPHNKIDDTIRWLARGPRTMVNSFEGYDINGYTFYTTRQDCKSVLQNSGVMVVASIREFASAKDTRPISATTMYYGIIDEIWEINYIDFTVSVFRCMWADTRRGTKTDSCGFTLIDSNRLSYTSEPFILGSQAKQVFYVTDNLDPHWYIVIPGKRYILGVEDVVDEEEYDRFDDTPPLFVDAEPIPEGDDFNLTYMRSDLTKEDGTFV